MTSLQAWIQDLVAQDQDQDQDPDRQDQDQDSEAQDKTKTKTLRGKTKTKTKTFKIQSRDVSRPRLKSRELQACIPYVIVKQWRMYDLCMTMVHDCAVYYRLQPNDKLHWSQVWCYHVSLVTSCS